jgi:hypothetical protein
MKEMLISVKGENDRIYKFYMPFNSPLHECYSASVNIANEIAKLFNEAIERQKKDKDSSVKDTSVKDTSVADTSVADKTDKPIKSL